jgi:hypothetical protein
MLVGQLPRTYRSLPRPNLMTPRHPPRALRSLTTPIGPPQSTPSQKEGTTKRPSSRRAFFEAGNFPVQRLATRELGPDLMNSRSVRVLNFELLVASSQSKTFASSDHWTPAPSDSDSTVLWRVPLTLHVLGIQAGSNPTRILARGCVIRVVTDHQIVKKHRASGQTGRDPVRLSARSGRSDQGVRSSKDGPTPRSAGLVDCTRRQENPQGKPAGYWSDLNNAGRSRRGLTNQ